jgi:transposase
VRITRTEHSAGELRAVAGKCRDASQARRLLALASIMEGSARAEAARLAGMDRQTLRDWVHRYNEGGVDALVSRVAPGRAPSLTAEQMAELRQLVIDGPDPAVHQVIRWRCVDLRDEVARRFSVTVDVGTIGKWLNAMGLTRLQPRPFHPRKDEAAQAAFKKRARIGSPPVAAETGHAMVDLRGAAEKFLVDLTPLKNLVHGLLRT